MQVLVTGATGFLGSHLCFHLLKAGYTVHALRRENSSLHWFREIFRMLEKRLGPADLSGLKWVEGEVLDPVSLESAMKECSRVFHCAATVSFDPRLREEMYRVNVEGTANVVNACLHTGIAYLCHVSSIAALGRLKPGELITEETEWKDSPYNTHYAISKYRAELEVWRGREEGLEVCVVNPSVILGSGNWRSGSASLFRTFYRGLRFYPPGTNGMVDAEDVSKCMIGLSEKNISGERFILSSDNVSWKRLFDGMAAAMNKKPPGILLRRWMTELGWRAAAVLSIFTGGRSLFTRETAVTSRNAYYYSSEKVCKALDFTFKPIEQSITEISQDYLEFVNGRSE